MKLRIQQLSAVMVLVGFLTGCDFVKTCESKLDSYFTDDRFPTLYSKNEQNQCETVNARFAETGTYFSDNACTTPINFVKEEKAQYCAREFKSTDVKYGSAEDVAPNSDAWSLGYSSVIPATIGTDGGYKELSGKYDFKPEIPLLQRVEYKKRGGCSLEMRVYKKAGSHSGTPIVMLHGGGWQYRRDTAHSAEALISRFTEENFVVYMPFYRLLDHKSDQAPEACNGATSDVDNLALIKQDNKDAINWIIQNNQKYTSSSEKLRLTGQSAGGFMAVYLAQQFPNQVEKIAPMYGAPDLKHQLFEVKKNRFTGIYLGQFFKLVAGKPFLSLINVSYDKNPDDTDSTIKTNSLLEAVSNNPSNFPRAFITHGSKDIVVSPSQSVRLCDALTGNLSKNDASIYVQTALNKNYLQQENKQIVEFTDGEYKQNCGNGSELHILEKGGHHFDYNCLLSAKNSKGMNCRTNDEGGTDKAIELIEKMVEWLK